MPAPSAISYTYFYTLNIHSSPVHGVYCIFLELLVKTPLVPLIFLIIWCSTLSLILSMYTSSYGFVGQLFRYDFTRKCLSLSCIWLCDPMDHSLPGSSAHKILWARILEYSIYIPNTFPSPEDLPNPGIKPRSPASLVDSFPSEPPGKPDFTSGREKKSQCF